MKLNVQRPTPEECSARTRLVVDYYGRPRDGYATWYPQMGGYSGPAIVMPDSNECFDVFIWHDGEFPFDSEEGRQPAELHHCMAQQFIQFGQEVIAFIEGGLPVSAPTEPDGK